MKNISPWKIIGSGTADWTWEACGLRHCRYHNIESRGRPALSVKAAISRMIRPSKSTKNTRAKVLPQAAGRLQYDGRECIQWRRGIATHERGALRANAFDEDVKRSLAMRNKLRLR